MRKTRKIAIVVAVLFVVFVIALFLHSAGSKSALEKYKAELRAKGDKLTYVEIAVPPSTNAEHIECREFFATNEFRIAGGTTLLEEYVAFGKVKIAWRGRLHIYNVQAQGGTNEPNFAFQDWKELEQTNKTLQMKVEKLRAVLKSPAPDSGWAFQDTMQSLTNSWTQRVPLVAMREAFYALEESGVAEMHRGDREGAFNDLRASIALTELFKNEPTVVAQMVRTAVATGGILFTWQALQMPGWSEAELRTLQEEWEKVDLLGGVVRGLQGERALQGILIEEIRNTSSSKLSDYITPTTATNRSSSMSLKDYWEQRIIPLAYRTTSMNEDAWLWFQQATAPVEEMRMLQAGGSWPEASLTFSNRMAVVEKRVDSAMFHRFQMTIMLAPMFDRESRLKRVTTTETLRRLGIVAIAAKRYELKYGRKPPNLAALVPEFLAAIPVDLMSGKPLCYRLKDDGAYVLYSVGLDGKDDGGDPTPVSTNDKLDLWGGRDAVWPSAASDEEVAREEAAALQNTNKAK